MEAECVAVFHYCCSVMTKHPLLIGLDNMANLFEKNQRTLQSGAQHRSSPYAESNDKRTKRNDFLQRFIGLHGTLFHWSRELGIGGTQGTYKHLAASAASDAHRDGAARRILMTTSTLIQEVELLLLSSALRDELLVKIVVICVFSVHMPALFRHITSRSDSVVLEKHMLCFTRSFPESAALILIFGIMNK